ncbi:centrosomal protein of 135 kDa isoform X3 [Harmonia axyridis]|uniref:centrosomal protein of 135 kDa isoform X3 n=1 Tax=Harmonia axyridis TaxID=115357 RepID=UPI001E276D25|nr:centrosomal protein of 135 kDa isoform X3 [Harmonia axyridis]
MEENFSRIRRELDSLGYFQMLSLDSIPLVDKLLDDLKTTTVSLQKYMRLAQTATKEKEDLELCLGPRKFDNTKLLRECNDLHLTYTNYRSQKERDIKELRNKVLFLNEQNNKLVLENEKLRTSLRETELDLMKAGTVPKKSQSVSKGGSKPQCPSNYSSPDEDLQRENLEIRHELNELKKELKNLQCKCRQLESLEDSDQEELGEEEISKKGGIDYKYPEDKIQRLENEIHSLKREKNDLENNYKEALSKQHEAMKRAIHLAERNKELEKELKDIDQMAIAVEEECNDAVKTKTQKLTKVEMALKDSLQEIQTLERTIAGMKKEKHQLDLNNDILRTEKKRMQEMVADMVKEKSEVLEQVDSLKLIEHDLNMEIDRLIQESSSQKRVIAELESKMVIVQAAMPYRGPGGDTIVQAVTVKTGKDRPCPPCQQPPNISQNVYKPCPATVPPKPDPSGKPCTCDMVNKPLATCECSSKMQSKCCAEKETYTDFKNVCPEKQDISHFQDMMKKEIESCQCEIKKALQKVTQERNHYMEEYHKLVNQMYQQTQNAKSPEAATCPICPKTRQVVEFLQHENRMLSKEKMTLAARLEQTRVDNEIVGKCNKTACRRIQRERDLFKADVTRLEEECDCLRDNIKVLCEAKAREHETFTQQVNDYERKLKKIESERGELMNAQGTRRAQLNSLEEKNELMKEVLRTTQDDLQNQKILYSQLKCLHDQTDKALHDTQAQLVQVEHELSQALQIIDQLKNPPNPQCGEADITTMKRQLNKLDQEKDELLNIVDSKTEEIDSLRKDLKCKCGIIDELKGKNAGLKDKLGDVTDRAASNEAYLKHSDAEIARLRQQLEIACRTRDNAIEMNRKLHDDLSSVSREANNFKTQLTKSQEQIENLKVQSQQYIGEVKRAEDLIDSKEKEREDLLNQFKQLCLETNNLQSSNNALETEANQSKVQLSVAMDHVHDLEQRSETLETLINDYEKQIGLLTNQIAKFESERNQHMRYQDRTEAELKSVRELCMKLDREKEQLRIQLLTKETGGDQIKDLQRENDKLNAKLTDSQSRLANTERLLKDSRNEGVELKLKDEEALKEINTLKGRIDDLEKRLYFCTCDVCSEKCIGGIVCEKQCIKGFQGQNKNQGGPDSSIFGSSTPGSTVPDSDASQNDGTLVATAQVLVTDRRGDETVQLNISEPHSSKISISSIRLSDRDGELLVEKRSFKGVKVGRSTSPVTCSLSSKSTRDAICDCKLTSSSGSSNKSVNALLEMDRLKTSLKQTLGRDLPETYCKTGKCFGSCKSFDPLNKVCCKSFSDKDLRRGKSRSDEKDLCCPSSCRCALSN